MYARAECADNDAHDDRASGNAQLHRCAHARNADRYHAQSQTEQQSEEYGTQIGLVEHLNGVAQISLGMVYVLRSAHHGDAVSVLQVQIVGSQQLDVASHHAAHVHSV